MPSSGQITLGEIRVVLHLPLLPLRVRAELGGQKFRHLWCRCEARAGIEQQGAGAAGEDVFHGAGHLVARGPEDFRLDVGKAGMKFPPGLSAVCPRSPHTDGTRVLNRSSLRHITPLGMPVVPPV